jgi:hypothetical protein
MTLVLTPLKFKCDAYENDCIVFVFTDGSGHLRTADNLPVTVIGIESAKRFVAAHNSSNKDKIRIDYPCLTAWKWRNRENMRMEYGRYKRLPEYAQSKLEELYRRSFDHNRADYGNLHYLHISDDGKGVAYTPDQEHGVLDKRLKTTFERYLTKYFSAFMQPHEIRDFAAALNVNEFSVTIGDTRADFKFAYSDQELCSPSSGFRSCMSYDADHYNLRIHPAEIYAAGDLAIAILPDPINPTEKVLARTIIHKENETYARIYATGEPMRKILARKLEEMGYSFSDDLTGAKILRIEKNGYLVMPYIDGTDSVYDIGSDNYLQIGEGDSEIGTADSTGGRISFRHRFHCDHCGDASDQDESDTVRTGPHSWETWCCYCAENNAFFCNATEETYSEDNYTRTEIVIRVRNGEVSRHETVCAEMADSFFHCEYSDEDCSDALTQIEVETRHGTQIWCKALAQDAYFHCENSDMYYSVDDYKQVEVRTAHGIETWSSECEDETFWCAKTGETYARDDFEQIEVQTRNGAEIWCSEKTLNDCFDCAKTGLVYSCDDFHDMEVRTISGEIQTWCRQATKGEFFYNVNANFLCEVNHGAFKTLAEVLNYMIRMQMAANSVKG